MKIIQLLLTPNDSRWQNTLLGLADDGGTYSADPSGKWVPYLAPLAPVPVPAAVVVREWDIWLHPNQEDSAHIPRKGDAPDEAWELAGWRKIRVREVGGGEVKKYTRQSKKRDGRHFETNDVKAVGIDHHEDGKVVVIIEQSTGDLMITSDGEMVKLDAAQPAAPTVPEWRYFIDKAGWRFRVRSIDGECFKASPIRWERTSVDLGMLERDANTIETAAAGGEEVEGV